MLVSIVVAPFLLGAVLAIILYKRKGELSYEVNAKTLIWALTGKFINVQLCNLLMLIAVDRTKR